MWTVYALKSAANGKEYIGMTGNLQQRVKAHRIKRKDLYGGGYAVEILSRHRKIERAALAEARAIVLRNTLEPNGNNRHRGGLMGGLRKLSGSNASLATGKDFLQNARDAIAIARRAKNQGPLSERVLWRRKRQAWQRQKDGLSPLPGTEELLATPIVRKPRPKSACQKQSATMRRKFAEMRINGISLPSPRGYKRKTVYSQERKDQIALKKLQFEARKGQRLSHKGIVKRSRRAKARANKGLPAIPGTEFFVTLQTSIAKTIAASKEERRAFVARMVNEANDWAAKYAKDAGWISD